MISKRLNQISVLKEAGDRIITNISHPWPDFVIVGAAKAGTTLMFHLLRQHPQVLVGDKKEIHYFDNRYDRGESWYKENFPTKSELKEASAIGETVITGEASPYYMFHPHAIRRMAADIPGARVIVMVRDPVSRARSHHQHNVRKGEETLSFEEAIRLEDERVAGELERMIEDESYYSVPYRRYSYVSRGHYAKQLSHIYEYYPREQVTVLQSEPFFDDSRSVFAELCSFLGIGEYVPSDMKARNEGEYSREIGEVERGLYEYFRPHNRALYEMVGVDFGWDETGPG